MFNKNYNCSLHPLFHFFIILCVLIWVLNSLLFLMLFYDVVWLLRLSFFCFKIEIEILKSNNIFQNVSQKSVPKICCVINFWWTLHSSVYIEHFSPSNLKVQFPRYILDSWIINRFQFRISDQNWHFTSATNEVWCDSNRHLSLPITCSSTDLLAKYAAWR